MIENIVNELQGACRNEYYSGADFLGKKSRKGV